MFYGSVFYQLPADGTTTSNDYTDRLSLLFFSLLLQMMSQMDTISAMMEDRLMFYRERGASAYGPFAYWVSLWVPQVPCMFMNVILYCAVMYPMAGLRPESDAWGTLFFFMLFANYCSMFGAFTISAIAASTQVALSYFPIFLLFNMAYAGYLMIIKDLPIWQGAWLPYICMLRYAFQGLVLNEFADNDDLPLGDELIRKLGFGIMTLEGCVGLMFVMLGFFALTLYIALSYVDFEQR